MSTDSATTQPTRNVRAWGVLLVVCGALFLEGIDIAMLNVAVPDIAADIGLATGSAHWVISAYVLGYAGFMLLGGRSADLFGRRRVFLLALLAFVAFSGLGGLAGEAWMLVAARFVTGVAAGFMTPAGFSIVTSSFPEGPLRNRALTIYGAIGAGGFVLGTVAGGLLTTVSWRWVFFAPMALSALILIAGYVLIRGDTRASRGGGFDIGGAVTATTGMVALLYALVTFGESQDVRAGTTALALAALSIIAFVVIEARSSAPLVRLSLLRRGTLPFASLAGLLFIAAFFGFQFTITLYLQDLRGWTPLETGMTFAVMGIDLVLAPIFTPGLVERFGNARVMTAGLFSAAGAAALALRLEPDWTYPDLLPSLLLIAVAFALVYGPLTAAATEGLDEAEHGVAGGVVYTAFQLGAALGLAIVTVVLVDHGGSLATSADYRRALLVPTSFAVLAVVVGLVAVSRTRGAQGPTDCAVPADEVPCNA
ncbi:MFS transporter [Solicola gregarius]|uniref:MFS transporter n=1 Tax=Solicola gregarius TaxID=2908642 RepID=A0AA46YM65_9ACTN|nr:MFS transporter [Solicola gregarius]UYM07392.1 MFS transporter [Solicola gregarius]